jgi:DNA-directed RNA polymerase specialized sigma24 family protein
LADDREVWESISQGDADSFDAFYRENAPRLQVFLRQVIGNAQAAEDVAQETFAQLWTRPNGFLPGRGTLRAYVYGIARKRAVERWRKQRPLDLVGPRPPIPYEVEAYEDWHKLRLSCKAYGNGDAGGYVSDH